MKILYIEDEENAKAGLIKLLEKEGNSVDSVETADEAIIKLEDNKYDLILLDIMLAPSTSWKNVPFRESGKIILSKIRNEELGKLKTNKDVKIVAITAVSDININMFINEYNNTYIMHKPISPNDALDEINNILEKSKY